MSGRVFSTAASSRPPERSAAAAALPDIAEEATETSLVAETLSSTPAPSAAAAATAAAATATASKASGRGGSDQGQGHGGDSDGASTADKILELLSEIGSHQMLHDDFHPWFWEPNAGKLMTV